MNEQLYINMGVSNRYKGTWLWSWKVFYDWLQTIYSFFFFVFIMLVRGTMIVIGFPYFSIKPFLKTLAQSYSSYLNLILKKPQIWSFDEGLMKQMSRPKLYVNCELFDLKISLWTFN